MADRFLSNFTELSAPTFRSRSAAALMEEHFPPSSLLASKWLLFSIDRSLAFLMFVLSTSPGSLVCVWLAFNVANRGSFSTSFRLATLGTVSRCSLSSRFERVRLLLFFSLDKHVKRHVWVLFAVCSYHK